MSDICYGAYNTAFFPIVENYIERNNIELDMVVFNEDYPENIVNTGAKVVIARGLTAQKIAQSTGLPVIEIPIFFDDIAQSLIEASKISNKIALVSYGNIVTDFKELNPLLRINLVQVVVNDQEELKATIRQLKADGIKVIVGGKGQIEIALEEEMDSVLIEFSERALNHAFSQAYTLLDTINKESRKQEELRAILNNSTEGFLAVNEMTEITLINRKAVSLLSAEESSIIGKKLRDVFPEFSQVSETITRGNLQHEKIIELRGITVIFNMVPMMIANDIIGATILFREINEVILSRLRTRKKLLKQGFFAKYSFDHIIGSSESLSKCKEVAKKYASTDSSILILGETGVGKELFAQSIHNSSSRRNEPFVAINCSTLPENILESELFGYEKGTFTGALQGGKPGLFELANGGTIFLDEITEMSLSFQARLLRVLQERQILRLGGDRLIPIDVRVISATNVALSDILELKHIRPDLFYRINVLTLLIPPLRDRLSDIPQLIESFYPALLEKFTTSAFDPLKEYHWPGNIRQFINFMEKISVLSGSEKISRSWIVEMLSSLEGIIETDSYSNQRTRGTKRTPTAKEIKEALYICDNHYEKASKHLGIHRSTLWRLMKKYNI